MSPLDKLTDEILVILPQLIPRPYELGFTHADHEEALRKLIGIRDVMNIYGWRARRALRCWESFNTP